MTEPTSADAVVDVVDGPDDEVQHALSMQVTLAAIEARAADLWLVHAAGLADPETGATVALVAPSGTGKSTAAAHLGRTWAYLSDETVGVDRAGCVLAHPKPLSRVVPGSGVKRQVGPDEAGLLTPGVAPRLAAVVLLDRDGTEEPVVEPVRRAEAIALVAAQTSFLTRLPEPLHFVDAALGAAPVWRVRYAEVTTLDPVIASLLAQAPLVEEARSPLVEDARSALVEEARQGRHETTALALPVTDTLDLDDERLVLVGERVVLLSPVASVVHRLLGHEPITLSDLLAGVAQELPLPPEPEQALRSVLDQLSAEALVAIRP